VVEYLRVFGHVGFFSPTVVRRRWEGDMVNTIRVLFACIENSKRLHVSTAPAAVQRRVVSVWQRQPESGPGNAGSGLRHLEPMVEVGGSSPGRFARMHGAGCVEPYSVGSFPSGSVSLKAVQAMREVGYDISNQWSKSAAALPGVAACSRRTSRCVGHRGHERYVAIPISERARSDRNEGQNAIGQSSR
jgi:hypothetical protein